MPRRARIDPSTLAALAPGRVVTVLELVAAGMSRGTIARRVQEGRWQRLAPGVILLQSGQPSRGQLIAAARLHGGPGAVITGVDAVRHHGLRRLPDLEVIHTLIPRERRRVSAGLVHIERTARMPNPVTRGSTTVAPCDRAITDTLRLCTDVDDVRALATEAVQTRRTTVARLRAELAAGNQRGSALARRVLDEVEDGIRSAAEGWARTLHARSSLPPVLWNPRLYLPNGRYLGSPDAYFEDVGLAWESDSLEFHPDWEDDTARRRADFIRAGVLVVHHRPRRFLSEPERIVEELWSHLRLAATRPVPDVRVVPAHTLPRAS